MNNLDEAILADKGNTYVSIKYNHDGEVKELSRFYESPTNIDQDMLIRYLTYMVGELQYALRQKH